MATKLEMILNEISTRQVNRFIEKSVFHFPGTKYDLSSDNYDWTLDNEQFWYHEICYHFQKWKATANTESNGRESNAIIDLMNVLAVRLHKIELKEGKEDDRSK